MVHAPAEVHRPDSAAVQDGGGGEEGAAGQPGTGLVHPGEGRVILGAEAAFQVRGAGVRADATHGGDDLPVRDVAGVKLMARAVSGISPKDLPSLVDEGKKRLGSGVAAGELGAEILGRKDDEGLTVADWLRRYGQDPARLADALEEAYVALTTGRRGPVHLNVPIDVQKHVPWITWLSPSFQQRTGVTLACLRRHADAHVTHDNLFHSVLGLLQVQPHRCQHLGDGIAHGGVVIDDQDMRAEAAGARASGLRRLR